MKFASNLFAISSLIIANLIPIYGVMFWEWNVFTLMVVYWFESAIIGLFTILKMLKAEGSEMGSASKFTTMTINGQPYNARDLAGKAKIFFIPFFCLHYGIFMLVHLVFILVFFGSYGTSLLSLFITVFSLLFSHFISYHTNFIQGGEYKTASPALLFMSPYPRIIVMHLTIILGGILSLSLGSPTYALVLMVVLKIIADLGGHLWSHRKVTA